MRTTFPLLVAASMLTLALGCGDRAGGGPTEDTLSTVDGADAGDDTGVDAADTGDTSISSDTDGTGEDTACAPDRQCGGACCGGDQVCYGTACQDTCPTGILCGETQGLCCPAGRACKPDNTCGIDCAGQGPECGGRCCLAGQACDAGACVVDCGPTETRCGDACCGANQQCLDDQCVAACADTAKLCGANRELCCGANQECLSNTCANLGIACTFTEECELDEYCEPNLQRCVPRELVEVCEFRPAPAEFTAELGCRWLPPARATASQAYRGVVMTPVVGNLTDDNGDGATNELDFPDLAFVAFDSGCCTRTGVLVIVDGRCGDDAVCDAGVCRNTDWICSNVANCGCTTDADCPGSMRTLAVLGRSESTAIPWMDNSTGLAIGNLHPAADTAERAPEIVVTGRAPQDVIAFTRTTGGACTADSDCGATGFCDATGTCITWVELWRNTAPGNGNTLWTGSAGATPSLADLQGDGAPEVIIGNVVFNGQTGALLFDGDTLGAGLGVGNNAFLGPSSTVADYDLDGVPEILAGHTIYGYDAATDALTLERSFTYTSSNSSCGGGSIPCDGFTAVGNFDADYEGEIVIVRLGEVFVIDNDGALLHKAVIPLDSLAPYDGDGPCGANESGPPTIADFDGDGRPEIGTASADYYVVVDWDCTGNPRPTECDPDYEYILWKQPNRDCSSRVTGSSVFDFNGDGRAEVIYADENSFRVLDGTTGATLLSDTTHASNTRIEMPLVADIDNDGKAEVVVPEPNLSNPDAGGIDVWQNRDWVRTRRIWNQHAYHVTNVTEDGQIPAQEPPNWLHSRLNNFRQNVQPAGLFDAPDLTVELVEADDSLCSAAGQLTIRVTVGNAGAVGVAPGVHVTVTARITATGEVFELGTLSTQTFLLPTQSETLAFTWAVPASVGNQALEIVAVADADATGVGEHNECLEDNNSGTLTGSWHCNVN